MSTALPAEALRAIFVTLSGLPDSRVFWYGSPRPFVGPEDATGKTGCLVLQCIATRRVGVDDETVQFRLDDDDTSLPDGVYARRTVSGQRVRTIQVVAENYDQAEGYDLLEDVRVSMNSDATTDALNAAGLSVNGDTEILNLGGTADNRMTSFASADFLFNQLVSRVVDSTDDADTYIDTVDIQEEFDT